MKHYPHQSTMRMEEIDILRTCEKIFERSELWNALRDVDETLAKSLIELCRDYGKYLNEIKELFPEYTSHGLDHVEGVLERLEKYVLWIRDGLLTKVQEGCDRYYICYRGRLGNNEIELRLSKYEVYILLAAILLHDIGMSPSVVEEIGREVLKTLQGKDDFGELRRWYSKLLERSHTNSHIWIKLFEAEIREKVSEEILDELQEILKGAKEEIRSKIERLLKIRKEVRGDTKNFQRNL